MRPVTVVQCQQCSVKFTPRPRGYNARYCSGVCQRRAKRSRLRNDRPEILQGQRRRSYQRIKDDPELLELHRRQARGSVRLVRAWLADYKLAQGCVDCGYNRHPAALQLDHEGPKSVEIADARSSVSRLKAEIESGLCRVRCANCHSIKTWERKRQLITTATVD